MEIGIGLAALSIVAVAVSFFLAGYIWSSQERTDLLGVIESEIRKNVDLRGKLRDAKVEVTVLYSARDQIIQEKQALRYDLVSAQASLNAVMDEKQSEVARLRGEIETLQARALEIEGVSKANVQRVKMTLTRIQNEVFGLEMAATDLVAGVCGMKRVDDNANQDEEAASHVEHCEQ